MSRAIEQFDLLEKLGKHGYLYSSDGQVPTIEWHVDQLIEYYTSEDSSLAKSTRTNVVPIPIEVLSVPRRITFDTNPDDCNFNCIMCEQHSEYSPFQKERKEANSRRRRMDFDTIKTVVSETAPLGLQEIVNSSLNIFLTKLILKFFVLDPFDHG